MFVELNAVQLLVFLLFMFLFRQFLLGYLFSEGNMLYFYKQGTIITSKVLQSPP